MVLVGNKADLEEYRVVRKEEGEMLANRYKIPFFETSAKTGENLLNSIHALIREWERKVGNSK